jgi:hypothetical protein
MRFVRISSDFGIVIRKAALAARGVTRKQVLDVMEASGPFDEDDHILSFGPHFGAEAADEFRARLQSIGLLYADDFFTFGGEFPAWCEFGVNATAPS